MLHAEYQGIKEIYSTNTMRVPQPICVGTADHDAYAVFEKVSMGGYGDPKRFATQLAAMHACTSANNMFGWKINNTCGATAQPNTYTETWAEFWDTHRLGHMLSLAKRDGASFPKEAQLREKVRNILSQHECVPSLVHGDLWSGNQAYTKEGAPLIFDPAVYYGDREVDIAMTQLFGSNSQAFYEAYDEAFPRPPGHQLRKTVYNLYHVLNHYVLFGGGYLGQANSMIEQIIKS
ncbi:Fructosamine/Ketosamine-3-kinase [Ochromonadaceae sp. CCMP2298]|nr:Fructosamine/Ketosamine-3-kinase [Ochromonadaceae sp. CCMP2298]